MFQKKLNKSVARRRYLCEHSKVLYKVHEVFCICRDAFFEKDIEKEKARKLYGRMFKMWGTVSS